MHKMEYYIALKKKEIPQRGATWINFEDIMLSEISQSQKDKYFVSSRIMRHIKSNSWKQKLEWWLPRAERQEKKSQVVQ